MGDQQDGGAPLPAESGDQVEQLALVVQIEAGRRLIQEEQLWVASQRLGEEQALLLTAGQPSGRTVCIRLCANRGDHAVDALTIGCVRDGNPPAMAVETQGHQLDTAQGQVRIERSSLWHVSDAGVAPARRVTGDLDPPGGDRYQAGDGTEEGGLPRAVWPQYDHEFTGLDSAADGFQDGPPPKPDRDTLEPDQR